MKMIYVAGPYRAYTPEGVGRNVQRAALAARKLWREGWAVICPHTNAGGMEDEVPERVLMEGDLEALRRCDGVFMLDGWRDSEGSIAEHQEAIRLGLGIFYQSAQD